MKYQLFTVLLLGLSVGLSTPALATDAVFCNNCVSTAAAEREAQYYAPELKCESAVPGEVMTPENQVCYSHPKRLVLAHPASRKLYTFNLDRVQQPPYNLTIQPGSLSSKEQRDYLLAVDFYNELSRATAYAQQQINQQGVAFVSQSVAPNVGLQASSSECPKDTALSILVDSDRVLKLKEDITHLIKKGALGSLDSFLQQNVELTGAGINILGSGISVNWNPKSQMPTVIVPFKTSEIPSQYGVPDALIFDLTLVRNTAQGELFINYKLSDVSKIANISLADWKSKNDSVPKVTNSCVLKQLAKLKNTGDFRNADGTPSGFGGPVIGEPGEGGGGGIQTCTVFFYQSGSLLYVFNVPANQC